MDLFRCKCRGQAVANVLVSNLEVALGIGVLLYSFELKSHSGLKLILWVGFGFVGIIVFELPEAWLMFQGNLL